MGKRVGGQPPKVYEGISDLEKSYGIDTCYPVSTPGKTPTPLDLDTFKLRRDDARVRKEEAHECLKDGVRKLQTT